MRPITQLIQRIISDGPEAKRSVAARLGYRHLDDALEHLDRAIETGVCVRRVRENLARALGVSREEVSRAIKETEAVLAAQAREQEEREEAHRRAAFHPRVRPVHPPRKNTPIVVLALTLGRSLEPVRLRQDIPSLPTREQLRLVREAIRIHQEEHGDNPGLRTLGGIRGYVYEPRYGRQLFLTPDGRVMDRPDGVETGRADLQKGRTPLSSQAMETIVRESDGRADGKQRF